MRSSVVPPAYPDNTDKEEDFYVDAGDEAAVSDQAKGDAAEAV